MNLFEYNEKTVESLNTMLKTNSVFSMFFNFVFNLLWVMKNKIKKTLGKNVVSQNDIKKENIIEGTTTLDLVYGYHKIFYENRDFVIVFDLKTDRKEKSGAADYGYEILSEYAARNKTVIYACYERHTTNWYLNIFESGLKELSLSGINELACLFDRVSEVMINNLVFYKEPEEFISDICKLKKKYSFILKYVFHDFVSVCPSFFLLNKQNKPCEIISDKKCNDCLLKNQNRGVIRNDITEWRKSFETLFENCDEVLFFSHFTVNIVLDIYSLLKDKHKIQYHKLLMSDDASRYIKPEEDGVIKIGFVGSFNYVKGSDYFIELIDKLKAERNDIEPIVVGFVPENTYSDLKCTVTGKYERDDLGKVLSENKVDFVVYPSFWGESFSYVVQELMTLNVPLVLFKRGAPSERIIEQNYQPCEIAEEVSIESLHDATIRMIKRLGLDKGV